MTQEPDESKSQSQPGLSDNTAGDPKQGVPPASQPSGTKPSSGDGVSRIQQARDAVKKVRNTVLEMSAVKDVAALISRVRAQESVGKAQSQPALEQKSAIDDPTSSGATPPTPPPAAAPEGNPISPLQQAGKVVRKVKATVLDMEAIKDVASLLIKDREEKLREHIHEQIMSAPPVKPIEPIEKYRQALPCGSDWELMSGADVVRVCKLCTMHVYDFKSTGLPEALELILQKEGLENPVFYKRRDGKFITSNCPVALKRRRTFSISMAVVALIIIGTIALAILVPRPKSQFLETRAARPSAAVPHLPPPQPLAQRKMPDGDNALVLPGGDASALEDEFIPDTATEEEILLNYPKIRSR